MVPGIMTSPESTSGMSPPPPAANVEASAGTLASATTAADTGNVTATASTNAPSATNPAPATSASASSTTTETTPASAASASAVGPAAAPIAAAGTDANVTVVTAPPSSSVSSEVSGTGTDADGTATVDASAASTDAAAPSNTVTSTAATTSAAAAAAAATTTTTTTTNTATDTTTTTTAAAATANGGAWPADRDSYELVAQIGQGGSATVYHAFCTAPPAEVGTKRAAVAIKRVNLDVAEGYIDDLMTELRVMKDCRHPNLVNYFTSFVHKSQLWIVMEYLNKGSLLKALSYFENRRGLGGVLDESVIATILQQVLRGLEYLHTHNNMHRDIKSGNILLKSDGTVMLADFGVSAYLGPQAEMKRGGRKSKKNMQGARSTFVGTPCWMAPEVMEQLGYDYAADIWSLGITAIEMATGVAPYAGQDPLRVLKIVINEDPPNLDLVGKQQGGVSYKKYRSNFRKFVSRCLQKDPSKRSTATELLKSDFIKKNAKDKQFLIRELLEHIPRASEAGWSSTAISSSSTPALEVPVKAPPKSVISKRFTISHPSWDFDAEEPSGGGTNSAHHASGSAGGGVGGVGGVGGRGDMPTVPEAAAGAIQQAQQAQQQTQEAQQVQAQQAQQQTQHQAAVAATVVVAQPSSAVAVGGPSVSATATTTAVAGSTATGGTSPSALTATAPSHGELVPGTYNFSLKMRNPATSKLILVRFAVSIPEDKCSDVASLMASEAQLIPVVDVGAVAKNLRILIGSRKPGSENPLSALTFRQDDGPADIAEDAAASSEFLPLGFITLAFDEPKTAEATTTSAATTSATAAAAAAAAAAAVAAPTPTPTPTTVPVPVQVQVHEQQQKQEQQEQQQPVAQAQETATATQGAQVAEI